MNRNLIFFCVFLIILFNLASVYAWLPTSSNSLQDEWWGVGRDAGYTRFTNAHAPTNISNTLVINKTLTNYLGQVLVVGEDVYIFPENYNYGYAYRLNASNVSQRISNSTNTYYLQGQSPNYYRNSFFLHSDTYLSQVNATNLSQVLSNSYIADAGYYATPTVYNNSVYIGDGNYNPYIKRFNATNISQVLASKYINDRVYEPTPAANGYAYGATSSTLMLLNANNLSTIASTTCYANSVEYLFTVADYVYKKCTISSVNYLVQFNATSLQQVATNTNSAYGYALGNGFLYFPYNEFIYQVNASNISQTIASRNLTVSYNSYPVVTPDYVFVQGGNIVYQLNSSNVSQVLGSFNAGSSIKSSLAVAKGFLYFTTSDNKIYQLGIYNPLPAIRIDYPSDESIYLNVSQANYTLIQNSTHAWDSCWYSIDYGLSNSTPLSSGTNFADLSSSEGWNNLTVYCNDSFNNIYNSSVNYYLDGDYPVFVNVTNQNTTDSTGLSYTIGASDAGGISCFGVNDSINFRISCSGLLQNNTQLALGLYWLNITANDSVQHQNSTLILVNVTDGSPPIINITYPTNITNYSVVISQLNYSVTDNIAVSTCWWSNNSGVWNSSVQNPGTNWTGLTSIQGWNNWTVYCNDTNRNIGRANVRFIVDTIYPNTTLNTPTDGYTNNYFGILNISFNCSASDNLALKNISLYITNSSNGNFILNRTTNVTGTSSTVNWTIGLANGNYTWNCLSADTLGNSNFSVNRTILIGPDITAPTFNNLTNQSIYQGAGFGYQINATDSFGISCFTVNDTTNFNINCSGYLINNTLLNIGLYWINLTVNDTSNNLNSTTFFVNVSSIPRIGLTLISPIGDINATQNQTFQVSVNVSCSNADCGGINVSLDPIAGATLAELFVGNTSSAWGSGSSSYPDPINTYYHDVRVQSVYLASDLRAAGIPAGASIRQLYLNISQLPGRTTLANFRIRMNHTLLNTTSGAVTSWNTTAYGPVSIAQSSLSVGRLLEFNFTNNFTWDGTSNIIIDFSRDDSGWTSNGGLYVVTGLANGRSLGGASDSGYTWPFDSMVATSYSVVPKIWLSYVGGSINKNGLVSMNISATPFYTSTQNPYNLTLNRGQSQIITWTVNATGNFNNYTFFVYANKTADMSVSNRTASWNVTIVNFTIGILPPSISINYPQNVNYTVNVSELNYSVSGANLSVCWYSLNSGLINSSYFSYGTNFANLISNEGVNTWTVYCNGTNNTLGSSNINFYRDSVLPNVTLNFPEINYVNGTLTTLNISFNCSASDNLALKNISLYITNSSNGNFILNRTTNVTGTSSSANWTLNLGVGNYTWNCLSADTLGNSNFSVNRTVTIGALDATYPIVNITYPIDNTNYTANISALNYTASDNIVVSTCWWSNNSGVWNSSVQNPATNWTGLTSIQGWNNWTVYCNDSSNNINSSRINFYRDSVLPNVILNSPTINYVATIVGSANISFNCSASDNLALKNISLYITNSSNGNFILNRTTNVTGTSSSANWTLNLGVGNYTWNCLSADTLGNSNFSVNQTIWLETNIAPNVTFNSPANNTLLNKQRSILLNATVSDLNGYIDNFTVWFYGGYANGTYALLNVSYNQTNGTKIVHNWSLGSSGRYNWTVIANDGKANSTILYYYFNLTNFSISCEVGGPYQQGALVLVQGTILNESLPVSAYGVNLSVYDINNNLDANQNMTTANDGGFEASFSGLGVGIYTLNATATYRGYNEFCADAFSIGGPASFILDKIVTIQNITNTTIDYNITLVLANAGLSDAISSNITDSDSLDSPYNAGNISANSSLVKSYVKSFIRNSTTYYSALAIAQAFGINSYSNNLISVNSGQINLTIPGQEIGPQLVLTKNIYYNSENSTSVNYTISIDIVNSGGTDISEITVIDSDLSLSTNINLNRTQNYSYSDSIIIYKAASNTDKLFVRATAIANSTTYSSNQINLRIPGYGGPADAIVYAPASVSGSESFDTIITIKNMNPDIGQDFTADYWITNEAETINYSSGQQTIYVSADGNSNLTATLTSPSTEGDYRLKALVSWVGGTAVSYDSFIVDSTTETPPSETASSGGGSRVEVTPVQIKPLIDVNLKVENIQVKSGENISMLVNLTDLKITGKVNATLRYLFVDLENNTVFSQIEPIVIENQLELSKSFYIPENLPAGKYKIYLEVIYGEEVIRAASMFEIIQQEKVRENITRTLNQKRQYTLVILGFLIIFFVLLFVLKKIKGSNKSEVESNKSIFERIKEKGSLLSFNFFFRSVKSNRLTGTYGKKVYSETGDYIGKIKEVYLRNYKIDSWLLESSRDYYKKHHIKKVKLSHKHIVSIGDVMIIDRISSEYLSNEINIKDINLLKEDKGDL